MIDVVSLFFYDIDLLIKKLDKMTILSEKALKVINSGRKQDKEIVNRYLCLLKKRLQNIPKTKKEKEYTDLVITNILDTFYDKYGTFYQIEKLISNI